MDSSVPDEGKLFVGGIAWDTQEAALRDYFNQFGEVTRAVEVKRALSKERQQSSGSGDYNVNGSNSVGRQDYIRTKKIFVGGLPPSLTKDEFMEYFLSFGEITDAIIMYDRATGRSRGFGFITFDSEDAVDRVLNRNFHELNSKNVEVKRALPKEVSSGLGTRGRSSNSFGSYSTSTNAFNAQMESRGFLPLQPATGGYPSYPPFGSLSYGFPLANSVSIYGGPGAYATNDGSALGFGEQSANSTGYVSNAGLLKTPWASQPQAYGALGYGLNPNYGVSFPWSNPFINATVSQFPRGSMPIVGSSISDGSEGSYADSGRSRTINKNRRGSVKSNGSHNANEVVHHQGGGDGTKERLYNNSNSS
ncbi:OLC1v1006958C1 [Oldenlandia corymbosa var. corymbosa]|uniref:OLC1v1006958C1 n=1 Tax=Oldenlandia corymbosa var. corymbosa TaxID=529605 RepID=A0AAV1DKX3_OLDCO|nr:OLC1v1006958C1 [Oldenlandia corymbosa var. corymbosa]